MQIISAEKKLKIDRRDAKKNKLRVSKPNVKLKRRFKIRSMTKQMPLTTPNQLTRL